MSGCAGWIPGRRWRVEKHSAMADLYDQPGIGLSLIDRLIDLQPENSLAAQVTAWEQAREIKEGLCRDLTALLNTRRAEQDFDRSYEESTNSMLTFGITDFTSYNLKSGIEQERVRRSIERAIRQFEPRLARVTVTLEEADPLRPVLQLQIAAVLRTETAETILFDATLYRDSRRIAVSGGA
jgi:type VI secretion system protein ImpF